MIRNVVVLISKTIRTVGNVFCRLSLLLDRVSGSSQLENNCNKVRITKKEGNMVVCKNNEYLWKLDESQYIDSEILKYGVFERDSTKLSKELIKPGMVVADVGANFGYYTVIFSKLVGEDGFVHAFEPSCRFRGRLLEHLKMNNCHNVSVSEFGLSDRNESLTLFGGGDSATLHWVGRDCPVVEENIIVMTLDDYVEENEIDRIDFIKVDIDGHEPKFIDGAIKTIERFRPIILMEFMQLALLKAGSNVELLKKKLEDLGYVMQSEHDNKPFMSHTEFLIESMNCAYSVNIVCFPMGL